MQMIKQSTPFDRRQYLSKKTLQIAKRWRIIFQSKFTFSKNMYLVYA